MRLAVEPGDGWFHSGNLAVRRDQARDRAYVELGWQVIRFDESIRSDFLSAARQIRRIYTSRLHQLRNGA